jgi:hypothetical protein
LATIQKAGNSILRASGSTWILGCDWSKNWLSRNQDWHHTLCTKSLAAERKAMHVIATIDLHFSDFHGTRMKFGIADDDTYNMDETGFQIGCLGGKLVITHINTKVVYLSDPDNREMVSSVECVSGTGFACALMIILAGSVLLEKHFNNDLDDDVLFATSESGYSNAHLGMEWYRVGDWETD